MEFKETRFELQEEAEGVFHGHAAIFGNVDEQKDLIERGAFDRTIKNNGGIVPILDQHDITLEIGLATELAEDDLGLAFKGQLYVSDDPKDEVPQARAALVKMRRRQAMKKPMRLSFGYDPLEAERIKDVRHLKEIKLYEISLVTFPANALAGVTYVKSLQSLQSVLTGPALDEAIALEFIEELVSRIKGTTPAEGKPFAGYSSFRDCVQKNQDKDDPEAYCATLQRNVEGKEGFDKAGRRLSAASRERILGAIESLQLLLDERGPSVDTLAAQDSVEKDANGPAHDHSFADVLETIKQLSSHAQEEDFLRELRSIAAR